MVIKSYTPYEALIEASKQARDKVLGPVKNEQVESKVLPKYKLYNFKYLGSITSKYLEDLFMELDAMKPWYIEDEQLNGIMLKNKDKSGLRVYYSEDFNEFIVEPYKMED